MNLGLTSMMSSYYTGGLYPWNNLSYTGGIYPWNNSYLNGLGVDFSTILNKAYNTEEQAASPSVQEVQEVSRRKTYNAEQQEYHIHRFGECSWKRRLEV